MTLFAFRAGAHNWPRPEHKSSALAPGLYAAATLAARPVGGRNLDVSIT